MKKLATVLYVFDVFAGVVPPDDGRKWLWVVVIAVAATVLCALLFTLAVCLHKRKKYNKYEKAHHNGSAPHSSEHTLPGLVA